MLAESRVVLDQVERDAQFREIGPGLTVDVLRGAVKAGHEKSLNCTAFNSKASSGWTRWDGSVGELREKLSAHGWKSCDEGNLPTIVSPSGKWQVAVSSADQRTGREGPDPKTARPKGGEFHAHVHVNQMSMDELEPTFPKIVRQKGEGASECVTCMLLYYFDEALHEVRAEFSIPDGIDEIGRVSSFKKRLMLEPIETPHAVVEHRMDEDQEETEVRVERRAN